MNACNHAVQAVECDSHNGLVGSSPAMLEKLREIAQVAPTRATVLVRGESGTGKELIAKAIHQASDRANRPFVIVNCAAISAGLVESELFGHEKGAFTGATGQRLGRFEAADGGTLFLDEVGELPLDTQVKLLRVLQEGEFERVGGNRSIAVDVRIVAATNRNLEQAVEDGTFRADLFYRLNVFPLHMPPLRERKGDIPELVNHFLVRFSTLHNRRFAGVASGSLNQLMSHNWPGNIRELSNVIERSTILSSGPMLEVKSSLIGAGRDEEPSRQPHPDARLTMEEMERRHIEQALLHASWRISGIGGAAEALDINPNTLRSRMKKLGIRRSNGLEESAVLG